MTQDRTLIPLFDELRSERIIVRPWRLEDAEALHEAVQESRERLRPWLPWADTHQNIEETRSFIIHSMAHWLLREDFALSIWHGASGTLLGGIGMHPRHWEIRWFEIGYWLRTTAEGHGYITEAVQMVTDFLFEQLGAQRVEIRCDPRNTRSAAVAQRLGFLQEAHLRNTRQVAGVLVDTFVFSMIPTDSRWPTTH